jgi:hypothetical protein
MKTGISTVARAAVLASFLTQATGAADVAFMAGSAARPGLYPPPARLAPTPMKAPPARSFGMSLSRRLATDARLLESWLERWLEPAPAAPAPVPWPAAGLVKSQTAPAILPEERPRDRMLVVREPGFVGVVMANALDEIFSLDYHPSIYLKRFEGQWTEGRGVRFRINFFDVYGVTEGTADGFKVKMAHGYQRFVPLSVPEYLRKSYPIYFHHDLARAEIEIQNTGLKPIKGLEAAARQETLSDNSQPGASSRSRPPSNSPACSPLARRRSCPTPFVSRVRGPRA